MDTHAASSHPQPFSRRQKGAKSLSLRERVQGEGALSAIYLACLTSLLVACTEEPQQVFQGYGEAEYVRIAAPFAGALSLLAAQRGTQVKAGDALFALEQENEKAARHEAQERAKRAQAQLENLKKGRRPDEIAALEAQQAQAAAAVQLSRMQLQRTEKLFASGAVSHQRLDEAHAASRRDYARHAELAAQLRAARLGARPDEIEAAAAEAAAAKAALAQAEWKLAQKSVQAPAAGLVADTFYAQGEWVPAGSPVVALLPPQNLKVRFFVPEALLARVRQGQEVAVSCDHCGAPFSARISYLSPQAEYTPPVIYRADSTLKCNFYRIVWRRAAVASEPLKRPSKRSTDEALQAAHQ